MFINIILGHILGFVKIKVEGFFIERFINICISKKIFLWNMRKEKSTILYTNMKIKDFKKIRKIASITKCNINLKEKKGIPFLLYKYKKRKIFVVCFFAMIIFFGIISRYIWNIEILSADNINKQEILEELNNYGIKIGAKKNGVNINEIINDMRLKRTDIAWMGIRMKGTNAIIELVKTTEKPNLIKEDDFCNIVADKDGIITEMNVQNGTAAVNIGDTVKKGDILIYGWMEGKYTGKNFVHARGDIKIGITYSKILNDELNKMKYVESGKTEKKYEIKFNKKLINFYKVLSKFKKYDTINEKKKIKLFSNLYLPIEINKITNKELVETGIYYNKEEIIQNLKDKLELEIKDILNISNKQYNVFETANSITVELIYFTEEIIGTKEKINF